MKISLAITTYNRYDLTIKSFEQVIDDERIDDIVILDDASIDGSYEKLKDYFKDNEKVRVLRQLTNRNMSQNKADAIALCKNQYVIIFDSDNELPVSYLDALYKQDEFIKMRRDVYMPSFAAPNFDYSAFGGLTLNKKNAAEYLDKPFMEQCLNTCNMVVDKFIYGRVYRNNPNIKETDTLWMNYLLLRERCELYIVPGMEYFHRVHEGSGWLQNAAYNIQQGEIIKQLIREL